MKALTQYLLQDWQTNRSTSLKSRLVLVMFRMAQRTRLLPGYLMGVAYLYRVVYQILVEGILGIELPWDTQVGTELQLQHGIALVVNHQCVIGDRCILRHATTLGNKKLRDGSFSGSPKIGNDVDIGSNVVILGAITIGNRVVIGAGSVVVKDVPEDAVVAGNPAKILYIANNDSATTQSADTDRE